MYDFFFNSAYPYHVISIAFFILGVYILLKKQLPTWLSKIGSSSSKKAIGWILVSVAPISLLGGIPLSLIGAWNILYYLDPAIILIAVLLILLLVNRNKRQSALL